MKAIHVIQRYLPARLSGSEKAFALLCESLAKEKDHEIVVVTSNVDPGEGFYDPRTARFSKVEETIDGVKVVRRPVNWFRSSLLYVLNKVSQAVGLTLSDKLRFQAFGPDLIGLEQTLLDLKGDVIHVAPMPMSHLYATWQAARKHQLPLVVTPTMHFDDPMFDNQLIYTILSEADEIIAHTEFEKNELVAKGLPAEKMEVIPSSYLLPADFELGDIDSFRKTHGLTADTPLALFIGSKSFDKGTIHLAEAWPAVLKALPEARLIVAGAPTQSWQDKRKSLDMAGIIELDYITEETKRDVMSACDLLCVPSRAESFGMILLEAWAKAKPVVGGSAGATREMVDEGVNGYTVEFGDTKDLSAKLIELLQDKKKQTDFGKAGLEKAKKFTEDEIVRKTLAVYERAIKKKQG